MSRTHRADILIDIRVKVYGNIKVPMWRRNKHIGEHRLLEKYKDECISEGLPVDNRTKVRCNPYSGVLPNELDYLGISALSELHALYWRDINDDIDQV